MYSPRQEFSHARRRVQFVRPTSPRIKEAEWDLGMMEALGDSSNRTANVEPSGAAAFGQRTRCKSSGASRQGRFAIYGMGGAGKTSACFAKTQDDLWTRHRIKEPTHAKNQSVDAIRFRAYLAACLTDFSGDPPAHLNEFEEALTSGFDDLLRTRRLNEISVAYGDLLGKPQQHRVTSGNDYYRRLPTASMGKPNLHVISDQLSAILCHLEDFLKDRRDATTSSESLQFPLGYLVATPWHREERPVSHYNAAAHFESILQSLTDRTDGKTAVKSLQILAIESHGFWVEISSKTLPYFLVFYIIPRQVPWRTSEWLRFFFWWENDSTLR